MRSNTRLLCAAYWSGGYHHSSEFLFICEWHVDGVVVDWLDLVLNWIFYFVQFILQSKFLQLIEFDE